MPPNYKRARYSTGRVVLVAFSFQYYCIYNLHHTDGGLRSVRCSSMLVLLDSLSIVRSYTLEHNMGPNDWSHVPCSHHRSHNFRYSSIGLYGYHMVRMARCLRSYRSHSFLFWNDRSLLNHRRFRNRRMCYLWPNNILRHGSSSLHFDTRILS